MIDRTFMPQHATVAEPMAATDPVAELPLVDYDEHSAAYIVASLRGLSQRELRTIARHEADNANRAEVLDRIAELTCDEPWVGYDTQEVTTIMRFLRKSGSAQAREVTAYERTHRDRAGIVSAAAERLASKPA